LGSLGGIPDGVSGAQMKELAAALGAERRPSEPVTVFSELRTQPLVPQEGAQTKKMSSPLSVIRPSQASRWHEPQ